jgi:hypothetical protein
MQQWKTLFDIRCHGPEVTFVTAPLTRRTGSFPAALFVAGFVILALGAPLSAATYTWTGGAGTANSGKSWGGNAPPISQPPRPPIHEGL